MEDRTLGYGILGGTFNPVHLGHLRAAEEVAESLQLERVIFMPAAHPPHKSEGKLIAFEHRWRMLELAVPDNPRFQLSDMEHRRPGKSYSVETLAQLSAKYGGGDQLYFLLGLDAFLELPTWKRYRELLSLTHFVVVARPGYSSQSLDRMLQTKVSDRYAFDDEDQAFVHPERYTVYYREVTLLDISSSRIRKLLARGCSARYLLPEKVELYINEKGLYKSPDET
jgi:nicotinate-nucleotide adenylyltransferase